MLQDAAGVCWKINVSLHFEKPPDQTLEGRLGIQNRTREQRGVLARHVPIPGADSAARAASSASELPLPVLAGASQRWDGYGDCGGYGDDGDYGDYFLKYSGAGDGDYASMAGSQTTVL